VVAEIALPSKSTGAPMTYMHKGVQYIVTAVATREHPAELVALAVPPKGQHFNAAVPETIVAAAKMPAVNSNGGDFNNGRRVYESNCANCHGLKGEGVRDLAPALKGLSDVNAVTQRVKQGGVNMPPMQTMISAEQIRDVSFFVTSAFK
jgi:quinoprotein glucose dehydrogenase